MRKLVYAIAVLCFAVTAYGQTSCTLSLGTNASLTIGGACTGGGGGTWGSITGTLASQTDLQAAINARLATTSFNRAGVVGLWTSCTSGYLKFDGTCDTPAGGAVSSLTTVGTSGPATLSGGVLNIPQYAGGGSMAWPATAGIMVYAGGSAYGTSLTAPAGAIVGTTDTQTLTNKTVDGVSPATMAFVDPTSSIQTQLNGKVGTSDARLSDARTPTAHASTHVTGGTDVIPVSVSGGNAGLLSGADKAKLDGIAAGATVAPLASSTTPLMDGTGAVGIAVTYAKGDHVHPSDTSRAADSAVVHLTGNESIAGAKTHTGQYVAAIHTTTVTLDWSTGNVQYIQLASGAQTFTFANPISGGRYVLVLKQPSSGAAGTVTFPAAVRWSGASAPTLTITNNATDVVSFVYDGTNTAYYAGINQNF